MDHTFVSLTSSGWRDRNQKDSMLPQGCWVHTGGHLCSLVRQREWLRSFYPSLHGYVRQMSAPWSPQHFPQFKNSTKFLNIIVVSIFCRSALKVQEEEISISHLSVIEDEVNSLWYTICQILHCSQTIWNSYESSISTILSFTGCLTPPPLTFIFLSTYVLCKTFPISLWWLLYIGLRALLTSTHTLQRCNFKTGKHIAVAPACIFHMKCCTV